MPIIVCAVLATASLAAGLYCWRTVRHARRALTQERAATRLTDAARHRDAEALKDRVRKHLWEDAVTAEADRVLDAAITKHVRNGGGPTC